MTDELCVDPDALNAHMKKLSGIASAVAAVGTAATRRVGDGDYGAAFGWFASIVNDMLAGTEESIKNHSADVEKHVAECRRTVETFLATDRSSASGVQGAGS